MQRVVWVEGRVRRAADAAQPGGLHQEGPGGIRLQRRDLAELDVLVVLVLVLLVLGLLGLRLGLLSLRLGLVFVVLFLGLVLVVLFLGILSLRLGLLALRLDLVLIVLFLGLVLLGLDAVVIGLGPVVLLVLLVVAVARAATDELAVHVDVVEDREAEAVRSA